MKKQKCERCGKKVNESLTYFVCQKICRKCLNQEKYKLSNPRIRQSWLDKYIR